MQLCFHTDNTNYIPEEDGPIQLEFVDGTVIHVTCCHGGIYLYNTEMNEQEMDNLSFRNCSLKSQLSSLNIDGQILEQVSLITRELEYCEPKTGLINQYERTCGIAFGFSNGQEIIFIHKEEGQPRIYPNVDLKNFNIHKYAWL